MDADIYGHSIPRMLGVTGRPTQVEEMILPPVAHDVKVISIGMFVANNQPVVWRGPMLHRALQQFLSDVYWGDLDVLLMDLPPGTGDIAISVAQLVPPAQLLVVTTPSRPRRRLRSAPGPSPCRPTSRSPGSSRTCPGCRARTATSASRCSAAVAASRSPTGSRPRSARRCRLLGQIPLDLRLRESGDTGRPLVLDDPTSPAAVALDAVAAKLGTRARSLVGRSLGLTPAGR